MTVRFVSFGVAIVGIMLVTIAPAAAQIVALGASNTAGKFVSSSEAYPAVLEAMLRAKGRNVHVTNAGVSGDTTGGMLSRLNSSVPDGTKIVLLQYGGNDARRGAATDPADRQANIAKIEQQLHARGIRTIRVDGLIRTEISAGLVISDGQHLTVEGYRRVASQIVGMVR
jgi:acyl-CoA thioesterase-1